MQEPYLLSVSENPTFYSFPEGEDEISVQKHCVTHQIAKRRLTVECVRTHCSYSYLVANMDINLLWSVIATVQCDRHGALGINLCNQPCLYCNLMSLSDHPVGWNEQYYAMTWSNNANGLFQYFSVEIQKPQASSAQGRKAIHKGCSQHHKYPYQLQSHG